MSGLIFKVVDNGIFFKAFPAGFTKGILISQLRLGCFIWIVHQSTYYTCSVAFRVSSRTGRDTKYTKSRLQGAKRKNIFWKSAYQSIKQACCLAKKVVWRSYFVCLSFYWKLEATDMSMIVCKGRWTLNVRTNIIKIPAAVPKHDTFFVTRT